MSEFTVHGLGTAVRVDLGEHIDPDEFSTAWSWCLRHPQGSDREGAERGEVPVVPGGRSMTSLTQSITRAFIQRRAGELLMLHAGAVCNTETGASIAYVAPGGTGKTTLTRALGTRYGYLTDETVGIVPRSWEIKPYPKPLSTRSPSGGYPKSELGPDESGLLAAHPRPQLTTLALLRRTPGSTEAHISRLDLFDAITSLVPETSSLPAMDKPLHLLADLYDELGGFWLLEFGESEQLREWIDYRLGES